MQLGLGGPTLVLDSHAIQSMGAHCLRKILRLTLQEYINIPFYFSPL